MLALSSSIISFDIYVPCMPQMALDFSCLESQVQVSLIANTLGSSLLTLLLGPISDLIGRRRVLLCLQSLFIVASIGCAYAKNIEFFIASRFLQGAGGAGPSVLVFAIVMDLFERKQATIYLSYFSIVITSSLVLAPLVGGLFSTYYAWSYCFYFSALIGGISLALNAFLLPETLKERRLFSLKEIIRPYGMMVKNVNFLMLITMPSLMIGCFVSFLSNAAFYFNSVLDISSGQFSLYQGVIMGCNAVCSTLAGRLLHRFSVSSILKNGLILFTLGGMMFCGVSIFWPKSPVFISVAFSLYSAGMGLCLSLIISEALSLFKEYPAASSSAMSVARGAFVTFSVMVGSLAYHYGGIVILSLFFLLIIGCCLFFAYALKANKILYGDKIESFS